MEVPDSIVPGSAYRRLCSVSDRAASSGSGRFRATLSSIPSAPCCYPRNSRNHRICAGADPVFIREQYPWKPLTITGSSCAQRSGFPELRSAWNGRILPRVDIYRNAARTYLVRPASILRAYRSSRPAPAQHLRPDAGLEPIYSSSLPRSTVELPTANTVQWHVQARPGPRGCRRTLECTCTPSVRTHAESRA